jgi:hypothetical protein
MKLMRCLKDARDYMTCERLGKATARIAIDAKKELEAET